MQVPHTMLWCVYKTISPRIIRSYILYIGLSRAMDHSPKSKRSRQKRRRQIILQRFTGTLLSRQPTQQHNHDIGTKCRTNRILDLARKATARVDRIDWRYKIQIIACYSFLMIFSMYLLRPHLTSLGNWGYLGAFIINGASNATIIFPAPGGALVAVIGKNYDPTLLGISAGLGGTLGSLTAYLAGAISQADVGRSRWGHTLQRLMRKFGGIIILFFSLIPFLPADISGVIAGMTQYSIRKYLLFHGIGSIVQMVIFINIGIELLDLVERHFVEWIRSIVRI